MAQTTARAKLNAENERLAVYKFKTLLKREVIDLETNARLLPSIAVELSSRFLHDVEAALMLQTPANIQVSDY